MTATGYASVMIVAPPGRLREGLRVLLRDNTGLRVDGECNNARTALQHITAQPPDVVILDTGLGISAWALLTQLKRALPLIRCVCLVHNAEQQRRAQAAGADGIFLAGCSASQIKRTIIGILPPDDGRILKDEHSA